MTTKIVSNKVKVQSDIRVEKAVSILIRMLGSLRDAPAKAS